ncbi:MAG: DUF58 domain-containing protein [Deltaproteobacteria bacterium]|nr:DUF58 domain-containing protein [Deltaproteobacteria bacterium]
MRPSLTSTGLFIVASAAVFILAATLSQAWPLLALGTLQLSGLLLLFVLFVPAAAAFRRKRLEFAWWVPATAQAQGALVANQPIDVMLLVRNHSAFTIATAELEILCSSCIEIVANEPLRVRVRPSEEVRVRVKAIPRASGHWFLQGLVMRIEDRFGCYLIQAYFPNLLGIKVFPQFGLTRVPALRAPSGSAEERTGPRLLKRRRMGSDLRELREHTSGDPFKHIAWKATARTGKLMVREYESEVLLTRQILLDISPSMREGGGPGSQALDAGISLCAGLARMGIEGGDRVGLFTFDTRIHGRVKPGDGPPQLMRILEALLELHHVVDEDLTDLTDSELCSVAADYLAYQERSNVRLPVAPPADAADWDNLVVGTHGEVLDVRALLSVTRRLLHNSPRRNRARRKLVATNGDLALLRRFCRDRGIELPYRQPSALVHKEQGMAEAITLTASRAAQQLVLISDLVGISDSSLILRPLQLARRKAHHVVVVVPSVGEGGSLTERIRDLNRRRASKELERSINGLGITVIHAGTMDIGSVADALRRGSGAQRRMAI